MKKLFSHELGVSYGRCSTDNNQQGHIWGRLLGQGRGLFRQGFIKGLVSFACILFTYEVITFSVIILLSFLSFLAELQFELLTLK